MTDQGEAIDYVDGMADAIETRRRELQLSIGAMAERAGLTRQGLDPVRKGIRRAYQDDTINGIARALQWSHDWYDDILAGRTPAPVKARTENDWEAELVQTIRGLTEVVRELRAEVRMARELAAPDRAEPPASN